MLTNRIIGAFTFRREVYAEVEQDATFTSTAWILVVVASFLNQLGSNASADVVRWLIGAVAGTIVVVISFALGALVINWVGRTLFKAEVTFEELVRTLGLAWVWYAVGFLGVLSAFSEALRCVLTPALIVAGILSLIAWLVATKEALDLDWGQTIVTVFLGFFVQALIISVAGVVLALLGLGAFALGGAFGT